MRGGRCEQRREESSGEGREVQAESFGEGREVRTPDNSRSSIAVLRRILVMACSSSSMAVWRNLGKWQWSWQ
jgi:hypothetical protein